MTNKLRENSVPGSPESHEQASGFDLSRRRVVTAGTAALVLAGISGCCSGIESRFGKNEYEMDHGELLDEDADISALVSKRMRARGAFFREFEVEGSDVKFASREGLFDQLMRAHPKLVKDAEKEVPSKGLFGREKDESYVQKLRENFILKQLIKEYELSSDTEDFELQEGTVALDGQDLKMGGLTQDVGNEYLRIPAKSDDDLEGMLRALINKKYKKYLKEFVARVFIVSPEGFWHIPRGIIDEEKFKDDVFWIEFKQLDSYTYPNPDQVVTDEDRKDLKRGGQRKQVFYHETNDYPIFYDSGREDLIESTEVVEVPEESNYHICKDIYTKDKDNEDLARHTYPETYALIEELGKYVNQVYHEDHNLPENIQLKLIVNALGRTVEYQKKLGASNDNATSSNSSHTYYNAADISYIRLQVVDTDTGASIEVNSSQHPSLMAGVKALLSHEFAAAIREERALGVREINQACFHIVGVRQEEEEGDNDDSAEN